MARNAEQKGIFWTQVKLILLAIGMFIFCLFVLPPLYTLFCEVTGINGKTNGKAYNPVVAEIDTSRTVRIQFVATNNGEMPWDFKPENFVLNVHPGESVTTYFDAYNPTTSAMVGQAVPSLAPRNAIDYFHKTECFCFNSQVLQGGEQAKLGLQFIVDQELPKAVNTITLSYSLFDVTAMSKDKLEESKQEISKAKQAVNNFVEDNKVLRAQVKHEAVDALIIESVSSKVSLKI